MRDSKILEVVRLDPRQYAELERQMPGPNVGPNTTDLQAGFALGIQFVLKHLREGYVFAS